MKSRITEKKVNSDYILSIGMIVKNEEKHLDNCLKALKKLMDNVSSELIIVDTGSTDNTKNIAMKYTDKVYDFKWIDDFSAARNFGLNKAKGEWFMFLDADEYLDDDCETLIDFFTDTKKNSEFNSACYIIRNHFSLKDDNSDDFFGTRIVRRTSETKFINKIHEGLAYKFPIGYIHTVFHHYGYLQDIDNNVFKTKQERNQVILEEVYAKNPDNIQTLNQLIDISTDVGKRHKYIEKAIELTTRPENKRLVNTTLLRAANSYRNDSLPDKSLEVLKMISDNPDSNNKVVIVALNYYYARLYIDKAEPKKALDFFEKYFECHSRYLNNELDLYDMRLWSIRGTSRSDYIKTVYSYVDCCILLGEYDKALNKMNSLDFDEIKAGKAYYNEYIRLYLVLSVELSNFEIMKKIIGDGDKSPAVRDKFVSELNIIYFKNKETRELMLSSLSKYADSDNYFKYLSLVERFNREEDIKNELEEFIKVQNIFDVNYSELVYMCLFETIDIYENISKTSYTEMLSLLNSTAALHNNFAIIINEYSKCMDTSRSIKQMLFFVMSLAYSVNGISENDDELREDVYNNFIGVLSDYIYNIYNNDLLNDEDIGVIPEIHQFGYYMTKAFIDRNNGNTVEYVHQLRNALKCCENMKYVVNYYLDKVKKEFDW